MVHLGGDREVNLFWRDTKILTTKKEFKLSLFQRIFVTITVVAAVVETAGAAVSAFRVDWVARQNSKHYNDLIMLRRS
jgi:hypothetical protein